MYLVPTLLALGLGLHTINPKKSLKWARLTQFQMESTPSKCHPKQLKSTLDVTRVYLKSWQVRGHFNGCQIISPYAWLSPKVSLKSPPTRTRFPKRSAGNVDFPPCFMSSKIFLPGWLLCENSGVYIALKSPSLLDWLLKHLHIALHSYILRPML